MITHQSKVVGVLAIAVACRVPEIRKVTLKIIGQQSMQELHRLRETVVRDRSALSNQLRGLSWKV